MTLGETLQRIFRSVVIKGLRQITMQLIREDAYHEYFLRRGEMGAPRVAEFWSQL
jgi:hypothetical protein